MKHMACMAAAIGWIVLGSAIAAAAEDTAAASAVAKDAVAEDAAPQPAAEPPDAGPYHVLRDIVYADTPGADAQLAGLDLYIPEDAESLPVVVFIHGGGWSIGDKSHVQSKPAAFAQAGYLFASINYRLSPAVRHPAHVQDVAKAVAWIHKHARDFGGDPDRVFLIGHSSGAHLAALVATDRRRLAAEGVDLRMLKGVVLLDGAGYDIPAQMQGGAPASKSMYERAFGTAAYTWQDASPIAHIASGKGIPPFLLFHAGGRAASRTQSERLAEALRAAGVKASVVPAPDKNHASLNRDIGKPGDGPTRDILAFLAELK